MFTKIKQVLVILLFASNTLITPEPIFIHTEWVVINPQKPFKALMNDARVEIDISSIYNGASTFPGLEGKFPKGTVYGILTDENGEEIALRDGAFSLRSDGDRLLLKSDNPIPLNNKFISVRIRSNIELNGVKVYWKNFSQ